MIPNTTTFQQWPSNGVATAYSFPNKIFQASDLVINWIDTSGNPYGFTFQTGTTFFNTMLGVTALVSNVDVDTGCTVTFSSPAAIGWTIDLRTNIAETQPTSIKNQGQFLPDLHEEAFDRVTREVQDLRRLVYSFGIHGPDLEATAWPALPVASVRKGNALIFDPVTGLPTLGVANTQSISTGLLAPYLGLGQTAAEALAGVTPINYTIPPHTLTGGLVNVLRYGAAGNGVTNDLPAFNSAQAVAIAAGGGTITGPNLTYLLGGTFALTGQVSLEFFNSANSYTNGTAAILYSTTNAPILTVDTSTPNRPSLRNFNIKGGYNGLTGGGSNAAAFNLQSGIRLGITSQAGVYIENVNVFLCGTYGLHLVNCYVSDFRNMYIQQCGVSGVLSVLAGANSWWNVQTTANVGSGFDLASTSGSDSFFACKSEQNAYNLVFESGCVGNVFWAFHSERATTQSIWFKTGSDRNVVHCEQVGASEPAPYNQTITSQNQVYGNLSGSTTSYFPKPVQRVSTSYTAAVTGSALTAIPYTNALPTTGMGKLVMSQNISPMLQGHKYVARCTGFAEIGTTGTMTVAIFLGNTCIKAVGQQVTGGVPTQFTLEVEGVFSGLGSNAFSVYIGSSTASDSITMGGHGGSTIYGGTEVASIAVEEWMPSVG